MAVGALLLAVAIVVWHARTEERSQAEKRRRGATTQTTGLGATETSPAAGATPAAAPAAADTAPAPAAAPPSGPPAAAPNSPPPSPAPSASMQAMVARMEESVLMARLREVAKTDSLQAIELARAGNKKFPDSPDAPERTSILIHALVTQNQLSEGRGEAEYMVNHYPDSAWVREIEGFTGAHRHRNIRLNDAGQLEYY